LAQVMPETGKMIFFSDMGIPIGIVEYIHNPGSTGHDGG
jgi:hypothetical protein